jgi:hypothetical protein
MKKPKLLKGICDQCLSQYVAGSKMCSCKEKEMSARRKLIKTKDNGAGGRVWEWRK